MKNSEEDKEMLGGCCVCSDENGWPDNPLVYCDGEECNVAVHQACYGIVSVPTGQWFCCRCEAKESPLSARCELCPSKDGALKRTDSGGWAHVVCALYIPEVRFGNVTTMEPIVLQLIPQERFNKRCYICVEVGRSGVRAEVGACMQCNKGGCKEYFHVTCAQERGYLCEEAGNYLDNVKYCGYCGYHFEKLKEDAKKGTNVKTIPPYRPPPHPNNKMLCDSDPRSSLSSSGIGSSCIGHSTSSSLISSSNNSASERSGVSTSAIRPSSSNSSSSSSNIDSSRSDPSRSRVRGSESIKGSSSSSSSSRRRSAPRPLLHASTRITSSSQSSQQHLPSTSSLSTQSNNVAAPVTTSSSLDSIRQASVVISGRIQLPASSVSVSISSASQATLSVNKSSTSSGGCSSVTQSSLGSKSCSQSSSGNSVSSSCSTSKPESGSPALNTVAATSNCGSPNQSFTLKRALLTTSSDTVLSTVISSQSSGQNVSASAVTASTSRSTSSTTAVTSASSITTVPKTDAQDFSSHNSVTSIAPADSSNKSSSPASTLRRGTVGRTSSSSDDAGSSSSSATNSTSSSSDALLISCPPEKSSSITSGPNNLPSTVPSGSQPAPGDRASPLVTGAPSATETKLPATKIKIQTGGKDGAIATLVESSVTSQSFSPKHSPSTCVKKEEKMDVDEKEKEELKVSYTTNISAVKKDDPFTPSLSDFAIVTAPETHQTVAKRSRSGERGGRRSKRGGRDGGSKRGRWAGSRHSYDMEHSPPSSPDSDQPITPKRGRRRAAAVAAALELKESAEAYSWSPPSTPTLSTPPMSNHVNNSANVGNGLCSNNSLSSHSIASSVSANTLLLGNQINPASAVAQKMADTLHAELQAHSIYRPDEDGRPPPPIVGPAFPGKKTSTMAASTSLGQPPPFPQSLEQLLERQWELGSQFLMGQAQHFDIASLLSCLHQLRQENSRLEESVAALSARRDHLLAVNARLSVPLGPAHDATAPSGASGGPSQAGTPASTIASPASGDAGHGSTVMSAPLHHTHHQTSNHLHQGAGHTLVTAAAPGALPHPHGPASLLGATPMGPVGGGQTLPVGGAGPTPPHGLSNRPPPSHPLPPRHAPGGAAGPTAGGPPPPHMRCSTSPHDRRLPPPHSPHENGGIETVDSSFAAGKVGNYTRGPPLAAGQPPSPSMAPGPPIHLRHSPAGGLYHTSPSPNAAPPSPHSSTLPPPGVTTAGGARLVHAPASTAAVSASGNTVYQMVSPPPPSHHSSGLSLHPGQQVVRRGAVEAADKR